MELLHLLGSVSWKVSWEKMATFLKISSCGKTIQSCIYEILLHIVPMLHG